MNLDQLNIIQPIYKALTDVGYTTATEIQSKTIPLILAGRDVLGCAQTGTGKTAAFAVPILQHLQENKNRPGIRALILTPTRELALQIEENFNAYAKYLQTKCLAIYGGVPQGRQVDALKRGVDVLVATPGRLLDLMQQGFADISRIEILVLDEADHMLDIGFIHDIKRILLKVPAKRQTLFFSATMPKEIRKFANSILHQPAEVSVTPVSSTAQLVHQSVYFVEKKEKTGLLIHLLKDKSIRSSLVFTRTKHGADKLVRQLSKTGIHAPLFTVINRKMPAKSLERFQEPKIRVLVLRHCDKRY